MPARVPPNLLLTSLNPLLRSQTRPPFIQAIRNASVPAKGLSEEFRRRQAAAKPTPVIPQPDKFRPPSHSSRRSTDRDSALANKHYGPPLTEEDKKRMATKKYPNMMSPEGTWMHWFLHHRYLHFWISMSILTVLATSTWWIEFKHQTKYWYLMPSWSDFFLHPIAAGKQVFFVVSKHINHVSEETYYKRLRKREDIERRKEFRFEREREAEEKGEEFVYDARYWVGEDGVRRRRVKRWFGIWE